MGAGRRGFSLFSAIAPCPDARVQPDAQVELEVLNGDNDATHSRLKREIER